MSQKDLLCGYRYTSQKVTGYWDINELKKFAKKENRKLRKARRIERLAVYPVPGCMPGMGQMFLLY